MDNIYFLMHKDIPVCTMDISSDGHVSHIQKIELNSKHFPIAAQINITNFNNWWHDRFIPETRDGINEVIKKLGYASLSNAMIDNLALSLTDCYWIKPIDSALKWKDINLFTNDFVDYIGELEFNIHKKIIKKKKILA